MKTTPCFSIICLFAFALLMPGLACGGQVNFVLKLDDTNDFVRVPDSDSLSLTDNFTVEAWVKSLTPELGPQTIVGKRRPDGGTSFALRIRTNKAHFAMNDGATINFLVESKAYVTANKWHHVAGAFDGNVVKIYLDGVFQDSFQTSIRLQNSSFPVTIGREDLPGDDRPFLGQLDEVRIWNRALSETEIQSRMGFTLNGSELNLVAYWNFNDGTPNDSSRMGNNGSFVAQATATAGELLLLQAVPAVEIILPGAPPTTLLQVQYKTSASSTEWINLGTPFATDGQERSFLDSTRLNFQRFYRVIVAP